MKVLLLGATGGTGAAVLAQAVSAGHDVTVIARHPERIVHRESSSLRIVSGDVLEAGHWKHAAAEHDTVLSRLGSTDRRRPTTVYSEGTLNVLAAMGPSPSRRLVCLSSAGLDISPDTPVLQKIVTRLVVQRMYRHGYEDMRRMEASLRTQEAEWTVIRAPMLTDRPPTGSYRTAVDARLPNAGTISRADLAHYMLSAIDDRSTWKATVEISGGR
ncbi:NAD(P)-dependent oxidoreductase [Rhodococcus sp. ACT016]|uniref:NAD(P)-dependent oxidoreductase n=1 Tax=Rhodococcus sp. ACT016 TaxID=3134808 RepID=UPI003D2CE0A8